MHPAQLDEEELLRACSLRNERRSGPGGQHRNKVETAVVATHLPTGVSAEASERRTRVENHRNAVFRLRVNLAIEHRTSWDSPSLLWQHRCRGTQIQVSANHSDFPALLAELLNVLQRESHSLPSVAGLLSVTSSQIIKFLKKCPVAFKQVNEARSLAGLKKLH